MPYSCSTMATSHRFNCAAAQSSEAESSVMSCATTSSPDRAAGESTKRTTQPSSVVERKRASRRAAVKVASPHWVGGNVLTKPNRVLIVQVPSDRTAPSELRTKPHAVRFSGLRAACMPGQPWQYAYVPGSDQDGIMPAAATAGLARRTKGAATSAYPKRGTAGDGALEAKPRHRHSGVRMRSSASCAGASAGASEAIVTLAIVISASGDAAAASGHRLSSTCG